MQNVVFLDQARRRRLALLGSHADAPLAATAPGPSGQALSPLFLPAPSADIPISKDEGAGTFLQITAHQDGASDRRSGWGGASSLTIAFLGRTVQRIAKISKFSARLFLAIVSLRRAAGAPFVTALTAMTLSNRLNAVSVLEADEREVVAGVNSAARSTHRAGCDVIAHGEEVLSPMFVVSGWACHTRALPGGFSQIVGLILPGDGIGLRGDGERRSITTVTALTTLETVDGSALLDLASNPARFAGISHAVGRARGLHEEFFVNQIVRLGLTSPTARLAHLILELQWRLALAGLATEREFSLPITYETLSQAIGVTAATAARAMRTLRRARMVRVRRGRIVLSRPDLMRQMSGFAAPAA